MGFLSVNFYIFNDKGVLIEIANNIEGRNLVEITGVTTEELQLGKQIINNEHIINILGILYPYIAENKESIKFQNYGSILNQSEMPDTSMVD